MKIVLKISRFIIGLIAITIATTALAGSVVVVALQSESFRAWLIKSGLEYIHPYVLGKIEIGDISGNPVFGFKLLNVKLISANGSNVISTPQIDLNYQLLPFTKKNIFAKVFIHNPDINLTRSRIDSVWNFTQLFKPSTDSTSTPFKLNIEISSFEIENGKIQFDDNTILPTNSKDSSLDFSHIVLQDLDVSLSARINSKSQNAIIQNLRFYLPKNDIRVLELSGDFAVDSTGTRVNKLRLETDRTLADITASIDSLNILKPENMKEWKKYPVKLSLSSPRISTLELRKFIPTINFLNGSPSIELQVLGNYGNIDIKKLQLGLSTSKLNLTGNLKNLNDPDKLFLDVKISETKLSHRDVITYIPGLNLPNLEYLGNVDLKEATFIGEPLNFKATIDAFTAIGKVIGGAQLDLRGKEMLYTGDIYLTHANAAPAFKNNKYKSDFTGRIVINGEGVSLSKLKANTRIEAEASSIGNYKFKKLFLDCKASNGGVLKFDTLMIAFDKKTPLEDFSINSDSNIQFIPKEIKTIFGSKIQIDKKSRGLFGSNPSIALSGEIDLRNLKKINYKFISKSRAFDLSDITLDKNNRTSLTFELEANGSGTELDSLEGSYKLSMIDAKVPGKQLPSFNLDMTLVRDGKENRTWTLNSDIADAVVSGKWYFSNILPTVKVGAKALVEYFSRKAQFKIEPFYTTIDNPFDNEVDVKYKIISKDLSPIEMFLDKTKIQSVSNLEGEIIGTPKLITITSVGEIKELVFENDSTKINVNNLNIDINARNIAPGRIEEMTIADIKFQSNSDIKFNKLTFGSPNLSTTLEGGFLKVRGAVSINKAISIAINGIMDASDPENGYIAKLDTTIISLPNKLEWKNVGETKVTILSDGTINIDTASLQRNGAEIAAITGSLKFDSLKNVKVNLLNGSFSNLKKITEGSGVAKTLESLSGSIKDVSFVLNGTFDNPIIDGKLLIDSLGYAGVTIGNFKSDLQYSNLNLSGNAVINKFNSTDKATIKLTAESVPIDLAFADRGERLLKDKFLKITAQGDQLPLAVAEPFLPGIKVDKKRGGTVDLSVTASGKFPNIELSGKGKVSNARLLVLGNNLYYGANANLEFNKNTLEIKNAIIKNDRFDDPKGVNNAEINGKIYFGGFNVDSIDFNARSNKILVMSEATQSVNELMYGPLYIAGGVNGKDPLHFHGSLDNPEFDGFLYILDGSQLTMPLKEEAKSKSNTIIYYRTNELDKKRVSDSLLALKDSIRLIENKQDTIPREGSLIEASKKASDLLQSKSSKPINNKSFSDRILYDLEISIPNTMQLIMNFSNNNLLVDKLTAQLTNKDEAPLQFTRGNDGIMYMTGKVHVNEDSRYDLFFKTFKAGGDLKFTKDFLNPDLFLVATYQGNEYDEINKRVNPFLISVNITGTKKNPKIKFDYKFANGEKDPTLTIDEIEKDAISLLAVGKKFSDIKGGKLDFSNLGKDIVNDFSSVLANQLITDLLGNGLLKGFTYDLSSSRVKYITQLDKGTLIVEFGVTNQQGKQGIITYEVPLSSLFTVGLEGTYPGLSSSKVSESEANGIFKVKFVARVKW